MTPAQLRALLAASTPRPVDKSIAFYPNDADIVAIVATMNAADALVALWEAADAFNRADNPDDHYDAAAAMNAALRRLEELP